MSKRLGAMLIGVALLVLPLRAAEVVEQVLVRVNGDILTKSEFEQRQIAVLRARPELANTSPNSDELKKAIAEITPDLILDAVDEMLLSQRGRELGYKMADDQFKGIVDNIKKQNNLDDEAKFQEALKSEGMTLADLKRSLERQMLVSRVQQTEIVSKVTLTEEESKAYYDAHTREFTTPVELTFREILVEVPTSDKGVNVAEDEAARDKALSIRNRLLGGEPFARLAGEVSDAASKANGGLIGPINEDDLSPALQELVRTMKEGDISQPVRVQRGWQLLKVESKSTPQVKSFEDARGQIADKIGNEKLGGERAKYLDRLRGEATIVWRNDELKRAYEQALRTRARTEPPQGTR